MAGHMNDNDTGVHGLHDMHVTFSLCRYGGMSNACACGCRAMGVMP